MSRYPMGLGKSSASKLAEHAKRVELGEMECAWKDWRGDECHETATHVETITRTFVAWTEVLDAPLCDKHSGWHF